MTMTLERKAAAAAPAGSARARVTVYNVLHRDGDVVRPGSLRNRFAQVSRQGHTSFVGREPLAGVAELFDEDDGLYAEVEFLEGETAACEIARDATWSVGFVVVESHPPTEAERDEFPGVQRVIDAWRILEVSVVDDPASPNTASLEVCCDGRCTVGGKSCCPQCATREAGIREWALFERRRFRLLVSDLKHREAQWEAESRAASQRASIADAELALLEENEVKSLDIPVELRAVAAAAVERASEILGGPRPTIRWFSPTAIAAVKAVGMYLEGQIWLAAVTDHEQLYDTATHEVHHAIKGPDEAAAESFAEKLTLVRHTRLHVGRRAEFEDRLEWGKSDTRYAGTYLEPPPPRLHLVGGLPAGALVVDNQVVYERTDDGWRRVAALVA